MTLQELKVSAYLYSKFSNDDENYNGIHDINFDLHNQEHLDTILTFLRKWGCRQFKITNHELSANSLREWFGKYSQNLPDPNRMLVDASDDEIRFFIGLINELMNAPASIRTLQMKDVNITIGPVGAAKTLFGLRKNFFPPWDNPVINEFNYSKNGTGYCDYLIMVKTELKELRQYCANNNLDFYTLPALLGRQLTSLPKLIDEHFWVSTTRKCNPQDIIMLTQNEEVLFIGNG